jgi:hypothetical protein
LWKTTKQVTRPSATLILFSPFPPFLSRGVFMSKMDVEAARALAIAEALRASGARSLTELLDDHERHKEHLDRLCAKLEALPKVVKKKTRQ